MCCIAYVERRIVCPKSPHINIIKSVECSLTFGQLIYMHMRRRQGREWPRICTNTYPFWTSSNEHVSEKIVFPLAFKTSSQKVRRLLVVLGCLFIICFCFFFCSVCVTIPHDVVASHQTISYSNIRINCIWHNTCTMYMHSNRWFFLCKGRHGRFHLSWSVAPCTSGVNRRFCSRCCALWWRFASFPDKNFVVVSTWIFIDRSVGRMEVWKMVRRCGKGGMIN